MSELLEHRHLYQSVAVELTAGMDEFAASERERAARYAALPWKPRGTGVSGAQGEPRSIAIDLATIKVFCTSCDRIEPFNDESGWALSEGDQQQALCVTYRCQSCKGMPEVFLVRRRGMRLMLCGRAPMEHVSLPEYLPKEEITHFRSAVIAQQSGQALAGLFLLRVGIEQFVRRMSAGSESAAQDDAERSFRVYADSLPQRHREVVPSLYSIYGEVSAALHSANADDELFKRSLQEIARHFALLHHLAGAVRS
jgi:hypothetical protein